MSLTLIVPAVEDRPEPSRSASLHRPFMSSDLSILREPFESLPTIVAGVAAVRSESPPHRRQAAALIRELGGRTEAELRRELDRFFAARSDLSDADRTAIARAMSRFRNQLLHHPRSTLLRGRGHRRHRRCPPLARLRPPPLRPGRRAPLRPRRAAHSREPPDKGLDKLGHVTTGSTSMNLEGPMRCFRTPSHRHRLVAAVSS